MWTDNSFSQQYLGAIQSILEQQTAALTASSPALAVDEPERNSVASYMGVPVSVLKEHLVASGEMREDEEIAFIREDYHSQSAEVFVHGPLSIIAPGEEVSQESTVRSIAISGQRLYTILSGYGNKTTKKQPREVLLTRKLFSTSFEERDGVLCYVEVLEK